MILEKEKNAEYCIALLYIKIRRDPNQDQHHNLSLVSQQKTNMLLEFHRNCKIRLDFCHILSSNDLFLRERLNLKLANSILRIRRNQRNHHYLYLILRSAVRSDLFQLLR